MKKQQRKILFSLLFISTNYLAIFADGSRYGKITDFQDGGSVEDYLTGALYLIIALFVIGILGRLFNKDKS